jgi:hypothetical protein
VFFCSHSFSHKHQHDADRPPPQIYGHNSDIEPTQAALQLAEAPVEDQPLVPLGLPFHMQHISLLPELTQPFCRDLACIWERFLDLPLALRPMVLERASGALQEAV